MKVVLDSSLGLDINIGYERLGLMWYTPFISSPNLGTKCKY